MMWTAVHHLPRQGRRTLAILVTRCICCAESSLCSCLALSSASSLAINHNSRIVVVSGHALRGRERGHGDILARRSNEVHDSGNTCSTDSDVWCRYSSLVAGRGLVIELVGARLKHPTRLRSNSQ
eukprot:scaffold1371_cov400-Prasinococcus_capsulatus_cf.AAC.7